MVDLINPVEAYLVDLLQNRITINNSVVQVIKHRPEVPVMPCITLDILDVSTDGVYRVLEDTFQIMYERATDIQLDVWCYEENERQSINRQIMDCWYKEQNQHYMYCTNYADGLCSFTRNDCAAVGRTACQCPYPGRNHYEPLTFKHGLMKGGLNIEPPFDLDEYQEKPPILHSVFRCHGAYREYVPIHGDRIEQIESDDINVI